MLFGPGVKNITTAKTTKAIRSGCDIGGHAILGNTGSDVSDFDAACARFDNSMIAIPQTTMIMPESRSGPKRSPNTTLDAAEPTNGTSSANGTTCAAG